ncbi:MAG: CoA ester lyase [Deltaproteobacteria bacterium]|nr:CoA ester lyase [Deltaproteobacteria bacterium]
MRLRRCELSTPGSSEKMIVKAAASGADLVFLDLEDAVAPAQKEAARSNIVRGLNELDWGRSVRAVRVNGAHTEWAHEDLITVVEGAGSRIDVVILPKVKGPRDVWFFDTLLTQLETRLGLANRIGLEVLIEEAEALACVEQIAACCARLEALILGVGDLSASLGVRVANIGEQVEGGYPGDIWHYARCKMICAARANGLDAIDGPYANFRNPDGYRREANWASTLGCVGKWAIHPSQIEIAHDVFAPTADEVAMARTMVETYKAAESGGEGSKGLGGMMVDAATARIFEVVLERARLTGRA